MHWAAVDIMKCRLKIKLANLLPGMRNPVSLSATFAPEALRATVAAGSRRRTSSTTRITAAAATIGGLLLPAQQRPRPRGHHWPLQLSRATITATAAVATMPPIPTTTAATTTTTSTLRTPTPTPTTTQKITKYPRHQSIDAKHKTKTNQRPKGNRRAST